MVSTRKKTAASKSIPESAAIGTLVGITISGLALLAMSGLLLEEKVRYETIGYGTMAVILVSCFAGAAVSKSFAKRKTLLACTLSGMAYFGTLLAITALFFDGEYNGIGTTFLLALCGSIGAALASSGTKKRLKRKIR